MILFQPPALGGSVVDWLGLSHIILTSPKSSHHMTSYSLLVRLLYIMAQGSESTEGGTKGFLSLGTEITQGPFCLILYVKTSHTLEGRKFRCSPLLREMALENLQDQRIFEIPLFFFFPYKRIFEIPLFLFLVLCFFPFFFFGKLIYLF